MNYLSELLCSNGIFEKLDSDLVKELIADSQPKAVAQDSCVYRQEDSSDYFYIILEGWVKVYRSTLDGEVVTFNILGKDDAIAVSELFTKSNYTTTGEAVSDVTVLPISTEKVRDLSRKNSQLAFFFLTHLSLSLESSEIQIEKIRTQSVIESVADFFFHNSPVVAGAVNYFMPYSKTVLAQKLGIRPESLSRALTKLKGEGINVEKDIVKIKAVENLKSFMSIDAQNAVAA